ncbi:hypothetical protein [Actinophytocola sp.]|uniref:hypothetical protein n=1 Tax=Actinophytocola sp. TaxID=1872138 RepID=UPI0039C86768
MSQLCRQGRFASWNGTAPIDASSGDQHRHRLFESDIAAQPNDTDQSGHRHATTHA